MDLLPTSDQLEISSAIAELLSGRAPLDVVRQYRRGDGPGPAWRDLADMGVFGLAIPESHGGAGLGLAEEVLVFREFGRNLLPGPLLGTVLAAHIAGAAGDDALLQGFVSGELTAGLAWPSQGFAGVVGQQVRGRFRLLDAAGSPYCAFVSPTGAALVRTDQFETDAIASLDPGVALDIADLDGVPVAVLDPAPQVWWRGVGLVAAMQVGLSEAARDDAVDYAKVREQFGQVIGSFQAVKHRCAEMATRSEVALFQTFYASLAGTLADRESQLHLSAARIVASEAARQNSADNIVTHGAMGFSDESVAHLHSRRGSVLDTVLGTERWHVEAIAALDRTPRSSAPIGAAGDLVSSGAGGRGDPGA